MSFRIYTKILVLLLSLSSVTGLSSDFSSQIIQQISQTQAAIEALEEGNYCKTRKCVFITFWDFDGTILKGDCSEGLTENGKVVYKGLAQQAIESGFSKKYGQKDFEAFWKKYITLGQGRDHTQSYEFLTTAFAPSKAEDLTRFSENVFRSELKKFIFKESAKIIQALKKKQITIHVVSASPEYFVKGASAIGITPPESIDGIQVKLVKGAISDQVIRPITYGPGKVERIKTILKRLKKEKKTENIFILGGFGNSYPTDGNFLEYIKNTTLPAGKSVSVMINGAGPKGRFEKMFFNVSFDETSDHLD